MPRALSALAERDDSHRLTSSVMRGTARGAVRSVSMACATAFARVVRSATGWSSVSAISMRWRSRARVISRCRIRPRTPREECPDGVRSGRYRSTASREDRPAYQARRAASSDSTRKPSNPVCISGTGEIVGLFMVSNLTLRNVCCDNVNYRNRTLMF